MATHPPGLLRRAAKGSSWSQFLDYASPALFKLMPLRALITQSREFASNGSNPAGFARTSEEISASLRSRGVAVALVDHARDDGERAITQLGEQARREAGHRILELYFAQIFATDHAILDLRPDTFTATEASDDLSWRPRALYLRWQADFLDGLRNLYGGFYLGDDEQFAGGLAQLGLEASGDALVRHLGGGDQRAVRFETSAFHSSFHETFVRCREAGVSLHRNFLGLGVYLVCLYDALESLDMEFDVRGAFERVYR